MNRLALLLVVLLAAAHTSHAAGPAVADLFPADTIAYAEVREPAKLGGQVAAALAGSPLEDAFKFLDARRDAAKSPHDLVGKPELALLGLLTSPEVAAEFGKLGGVAAGLTGLTANGEPEGALVVLTGESATAGIAARGFLSLSPVRRVGTVDGVGVYQFRTPRFSFDPNTGQQKLDNEKAPEEGEYEATVAYTPGLFVYGTSKTAVGAVLARFRGKGGKGLGEAASFRSARDSHPQPGVFLYADTATLVRRLDEARRAGDGGPEPDFVGWFRLLANDRAVGHVAGTIRFRDGGVAAELTAAFAPGRPSPLLTLLSGPAIEPEFLRHAPAAAGFAATVAFPEKGRAAAVIGFLDAAAQASGGLGRTPGEAVKELEARFKTPVADGLIAKTKAATAFASGRRMASLPTLVLHCDSPEVAAAWEEFLPKLLADTSGGEPVQPSSEVIDGVKVLSLPGADLPWKGALHYARKNAVVAIGLDRSVVAAAVAPRADAVPIAVDPAVSFRGVVRLGTASRGLFVASAPSGPVVPLPPPPLPTRPGFPPNGPAVPADTQQKAEEKALDAVLAAFDSLPAAVVTARRTGDALWIEFTQPVGKEGFAPVIAAGVNWFDTYLNRNANPNPGGSGSFPRIR